MSKYQFSAKDNSFYASAELPLYELAGTCPSDLVPVAEEVFVEFAVDLPPEGKTRGVGADGMPAWIDAPAVSDDELRMRNEANRTYLMRLAGERIAPLEDAVDLGVATDKEVALLAEWKRYRVDLRRMEEQPGYPLEVVWPSEPQ